MMFTNNFAEIDNVIWFDLSNVSIGLYSGNRIIFYDTNSFYFHSLPDCERYYALDFFSNDDIIIITKTILIELINVETNNLPETYILYFKQLAQTVKNIIFIDEKDCVSLLKSKYQDTALIFKIIKKVYSFAFILSPDKEKINKLNISAKDYLENLYKITDDKKYRKNRGEISIVIILLIFSNYVNQNFLICSDDYSAYNHYRRLKENELLGKSKIAFMSTVSHINYLYKERNLSKEEVIGYLNHIKREVNTKLFYKTLPYETPERKSFTNEELVDTIISNEWEIIY